MFKKNKKFKSLYIIFLIGISLFLALGIFNLKKGNKNEISSQPTNEVIEIGCNRTSRLENKPAFDRALSLIEERYKMWEENGEDIGSWYFFPSQLVNCIQIVEDDLDNNTGLEGYFIFNGDEIKNNYFPIIVDSKYAYSDESITSLILVHEMTHVYQFLQELNSESKISCFDKESEAFYAQIKFYSIQYPEYRKSIDYRIEHDIDLHPQLQMIKLIKNLEFNTLNEVREKCLYGEGKDNKYCIDEFRMNSIKEMLQQDQYYRYQCE